MSRKRVNKRQVRRGLDLQEPLPEPEMDYEEEEDDLADLLEEDEPEALPPLEEEPEEDMMLAEIQNLYKAQDDRDGMTLQLAKAVQKLAKRVVQLEADEDDEEEDKAARPRQVAKDGAPEGDFTVGGDDDMGEEIQPGPPTQTPGLTAGQPQGIAQKAEIAKALEAQGVAAEVITKATGLIKKDDKWSNFGDKDSDVPANAPVTPGTMDWPEDWEIVPGSGNAPSSVKGIGSVSKALEALGVDRSQVDKLFEDKGFIRKAAPPIVGAGATGETAPVEKLEEQARGLSFHQLNAIRLESGDL